MTARSKSETFSQSPNGSVFATSPGVSFANAVADGIARVFADQAPEALGMLSVYVNSARMRDKLLDCFLSERTSFVPRIRLLTDLPADLRLDLGTVQQSALKRKLELRQMVSRLVRQEPGLAPISSIADLTDSLFALIEEMADEGVDHSDIHKLDVSDQSGHWERAQKFLSIVTEFVGPGASTLMGAAEAFREAVSEIEQRWDNEAPKHPILIAGSTGSRGTTGMLMRLAARTRNCAIVLPGFDWSMPQAMWDELGQSGAGEDHPQHRLACLLAELGLKAREVENWGSALSETQINRNALVSLALRPAPVTNHWIHDSKHLVGVKEAVSEVTIVEARDLRREASAIALIMREAVHAKKSVALITPDPHLTRLVTVALGKWKITPDMSMGQPFGQSPPGRFMRQILRLGTGAPEIDALIALLKHPLAHSGSDRGQHLTLTRDFELWLRRKRVPHVQKTHLDAWKTACESPMGSQWVNWIAGLIVPGALPKAESLSAFCELHFSLASAVCAGSSPGASSEFMWQESAGEVLKLLNEELTAAAQIGGHMAFAEYATLFETLLKGREVRDVVIAHPQVKIWGTLEARVQTTDRVILGGLNEGVWPENAAADPWLNRSMRKAAGLLSPERKIGLSAHDFQIAIATKEVFLTRSLRDEEAETVPSRWVNRLSNLLNGMSKEGSLSLSGMKERGDNWTRLVDKTETPTGETTPEKRPAPVTPVGTRPRRMSVTGVSRVASDPYAFYAQHMLRLEPVPALSPKPDERIKGNAIHEVAERALPGFDPTADRQIEIERVQKIARDVFAEFVHWVETRTLWENRFDSLIPELLTQEAERRVAGIIAAIESKASYLLESRDFQLVCKADRIDVDQDGSATIYDYKSGSLPSRKSIGKEEMQLMLEAVIAENGGFSEIGPIKVKAVVYLALKQGLAQISKEMEADDKSRIASELDTFLGMYFSPAFGFVSRRYPNDYDGDYDHLARLGEWVDGDTSEKIDVS